MLFRSIPPPTPPTSLFFFFNETPTTPIYTLSLHDALPISPTARVLHCRRKLLGEPLAEFNAPLVEGIRSEEHTSELQSRVDLVCRLLLEKKKKSQWRKRKYTVKRSWCMGWRTNDLNVMVGV